MPRVQDSRDSKKIEGNLVKKSENAYADATTKSPARLNQAGQTLSELGLGCHLHRSLTNMAYSSRRQGEVSP